ncbi:MAG: serine/threonine-protein kinase [Candidatus Omnitrophota bacterium]
MDFDTIFSQIMDKIIEGEEVNIEEYCNQFPQYREKLFAKMQTVQFIEKDLQEEDFRGRKFGEYIILQELGQGGMGIVFLAIQPSLSRLVTIKVLPPGFAGDAQVLQAFKEEAKIIAKFSHPNIIPVYSFGNEKGINYIAMAYVNGPSLKDLISKLMQVKKLEHCKASVVRDLIYPLVAERQNQDGSGQSIGLKRSADFWNKSYYEYAAVIGKEIAEAINYAHQNGIFHGDLKPSNILLSLDGVPMVVDFGLAKDVRKTTISDSREFSGTLYYAAPEQLKSNVINEKTDIWALGITLYELLTFEFPFKAESLDDTMNKILKGEPLPLRNRHRKVPVELEAIVLKCLEKKPENRYNSVTELSGDFNNYLESKPITARRISTLGRVSKWIKRNPIIFLWLSLALFLGAVSSFLLFNKKITDLFDQASVLENQGKYEDAIKEYAQAMELLNFLPLKGTRPQEIFQQIGRLWRLRGNYDNAIYYYQKALDIDPGFLPAIEYAGDACLEKGLYDEAIKYYNTAIRLSPRDRDNFYYRGKAFTNKGLWDEALQDFHTVMQMTFHDVDSQIQIVYVLKIMKLSDDEGISELLKNKHFTAQEIEAILKIFHSF